MVNKEKKNIVFLKIINIFETVSKNFKKNLDLKPCKSPDFRLFKFFFYINFSKKNSLKTMEESQNTQAPSKPHQDPPPNLESSQVEVKDEPPAPIINPIEGSQIEDSPKENPPPLEGSTIEVSPKEDSPKEDPPKEDPPKEDPPKENQEKPHSEPKIPDEIKEENLNKDSNEEDLNMFSSELKEGNEEPSKEIKEEDEEEVEIEEEVSIPEEEFKELMKEFELQKVLQEGKSEEEKVILVEPTKKKKVKKIVKKPKDKTVVNDVIEEDSECEIILFYFI